MSQEKKKGKTKTKVTVPKGATKLLGYGLVLMFLMVWVFILGVLTGRGDVNFLFQRLGLYKTNLAARLGIAPSNQASTPLPLPQPAEDHKALANSGKKPAQESGVEEIAQPVAAPIAKATDLVPSKTSGETSKKPGVGNLEAKKTKGSNQQKQDQDNNPASKHDQDNSLASKLSFQNSLDNPTRKQSKTVAKKEATVHTASITPHPSNTASEPTAGDEKKKAACAYQVKVASYRTTEEAEKTMADLKKKGINVNLQKGKDKSGSIYIIKTGRYNNKAEAEKVNKKLKEAMINGQIQEVN